MRLTMKLVNELELAIELKLVNELELAIELKLVNEMEPLKVLFFHPNSYPPSDPFPYAIAIGPS